VHAGHVTLTFLCDEFAPRPPYFFAGSPQVPCKFFPPTSRRDDPQIEFHSRKDRETGIKTMACSRSRKKTGKRYGRLGLLGKGPRLTKMTNGTLCRCTKWFHGKYNIAKVRGKYTCRGHLIRGGKTISHVLYASGSHFREIEIFTGRVRWSLLLELFQQYAY